ncbi:prolyl-tRNA synthetase, putative,bifunctional aminoacyl-tRNA synthetase, partial [Trypanosoma cruzi]
MDVNLSLAPVSALELLIKNDSKLRRMFSTTVVAGTQCEVCGWACQWKMRILLTWKHGRKNPPSSPCSRARWVPIHLTQTLLMQQYRSTWVSEEHVCTGEQ